MIGTTQLSTMRKEFEKALGPDPIGELDRHIANAQRRSEGTEVMEGLKLFLQWARKELQRKPRAGAKNKRKRAAS